MNMSSRCPPRAQQGGVLLTMALLTPLLAALLLVPLFFGQLVWHYSLAQKAAQDAARFLSTATRAELEALGSAAGRARAAALVPWTPDAAANTWRAAAVSRSVRIQCGTTVADVMRYRQCGHALPETVQVIVDVSMRADVHAPAWAKISLDRAEGLHLQAFATVRYAGS